MTNGERISTAIATTKRVVPGYFEKTCEGRLPGGAGSILLGQFGTVDDVQAALEAAEWAEFTHPDLMPGTSAFVTESIRGRLGVVSLASLDGSVEVVLDDRKGTGKVSCTVSGVLGPEVGYTVLILGQEQGEEVVFTFHPGDPVRASQVACEPGMHGRRMSAREALELGLTTAKIVA